MTLPMFHGMQQTVVLFVLGVIVSLFQEGLKLSQHLGNWGASYDMWMAINPHLLLFAMIPPLVTGDAMTIDTSVARRVAKQCMYMAGPGVAVSAFIMALFLWAYLPYDWSFLLCLTTGAILCATDPVAVVALLKELGASPTLTVQIQGESLLNDGTAIVLYTISYKMLGGETYDAGDVVEILVKMAIYAWGLGMVIGYAFLIWIKLANNKLNHDSIVIQTALTICIAYSSFALAEGAFHISGVLATVAAALIMAHKMWPNVVCKESMHDIWHMIEYFGNTIIFFLSGALTGRTMLSESIKFADYMHLIVIYILCQLIRGTLIFASRPLLKHLGTDKQPVKVEEAVVMTWGGLRGAIGLALAIQVQSEKAKGKVSKSDADKVLFYASGVAALTLMINALTCPALVRYLGITQMPATKLRLLHILHRQMMSIAENEPHPPRVRQCIHAMLDEVDHHIDPEHLLHGENHEEAHETCQKMLPEADSDDRPDTIMIPLLNTGDAHGTDRCRAMVNVMAGHKLVHDLREAKATFPRLPESAMVHLAEFPGIPLLEHEADMISLVESTVTEPAFQRSVNEAFLQLVKAQYWHFVEDDEFASSAHEAEVLLASITLSVAKNVYDLCDWKILEPFIRANFDSSEGRLSNVQSQHLNRQRFLHTANALHKLVSSHTFAMLIAFAIVANTIFVYIEQAANPGDEAQPGHGWLILEIFFQVVFTIEFILKLCDMKCTYFLVGWNVFDFLLVVVGAFGIAVNVMVDSGSGPGFDSSQTSLVKVAQIFRMARILRLYRLVRLWRVLKAKILRDEISPDVAEHMQKCTILSCFIRAHLASQESLVKYFGRDGQADLVEVARCVLQSQLSVYRAMLMEIEEKERVDGRILSAVRIAREAKAIVKDLEEFVIEAHRCEVISKSEAESVIHPMHHRLEGFTATLMNAQRGCVSTILASSPLEENSVLEGDVTVVKQLRSFSSEFHGEEEDEGLILDDISENEASSASAVGSSENSPQTRPTAGGANDSALEERLPLSTCVAEYASVACQRVDDAVEDAEEASTRPSSHTEKASEEEVRETRTYTDHTEYTVGQSAAAAKEKLGLDTNGGLGDGETPRAASPRLVSQDRGGSAAEPIAPSPRNTHRKRWGHKDKTPPADEKKLQPSEPSALSPREGKPKRWKDREAAPSQAADAATASPRARAVSGGQRQRFGKHRKEADLAGKTEHEDGAEEQTSPAASSKDAYKV